jgi:thioredoxin 1
MKVIKTVNEFNNEILSHDITCVKFSATWCRPCKQIEPFVKSLEEKYPLINFIHVDVNLLESVSDHYKVESIPCFIAITKNAKVQSRIVGSNTVNIQKFMSKLSQHLG